MPSRGTAGQPPADQCPPQTRSATLPLATRSPLATSQPPRTQVNNLRRSQELTGFMPWFLPYGKTAHCPEMPPKKVTDRRVKRKDLKCQQKLPWEHLQCADQEETGARPALIERGLRRPSASWKGCWGWRDKESENLGSAPILGVPLLLSSPESRGSPPVSCCLKGGK